MLVVGPLVNPCALISVEQVVEGIKPTLLELQKFETAPEDVELEGK